MEAETINEIQIVSQPWKRVAAAKISIIRENMSRKLPAFMVPSTWIAVEDLLLLVSGKSDKTKVVKWLMNMSEEGLRAHSACLEEGAYLDPGSVLKSGCSEYGVKYLTFPWTGSPWISPFGTLEATPSQPSTLWQNAELRI